MTVAIRVIGAEEEMASEHQMRFRILGPGIQQVADESFGFTVGLNPRRQPGWEQAGILVTVHQFEALEPGPYSLEISIDEQHKKSVPFYVHRGLPGRSETPEQTEPS